MKQNAYITIKVPIEVTAGMDRETAAIDAWLDSVSMPEITSIGFEGDPPPPETVSVLMIENGTMWDEPKAGTLPADQGMPWCEECHCWHHKTAEHIADVRARRLAIKMLTPLTCQVMAPPKFGWFDCTNCGRFTTWVGEQPPPDICTECIARLVANASKDTAAC